MPFEGALFTDGKACTVTHSFVARAISTASVTAAEARSHLGRVEPDEERKVVLAPGRQANLGRPGAHNGMLPCHLGLRRRSLRIAMRRARISSPRVRSGSITSSM